MKNSDPSRTCVGCEKVHNFELPEQVGVPKLCGVCARAREAILEAELLKGLTPAQVKLFKEITALREYTQSYVILS